MTGLSTLFRLASASLWNRRLTVILTALAIALSVGLYVGVDKLRKGVAAGFESTLSGADLLVGARSGPVNLLLYAVFRIGDPTANVTWDSYQRVANQRGVAWTIPLSLGDSYRGFRVVGTSEAYFEHYQYGEGRPLRLAQGEPFKDVFDAVLGAEVARQLGHELGDTLILAHGLGDVSFALHDDRPFRVSGILAPTGTPVDRSVHVSLAGIEAMHLGWETGARDPASRAITAESIRAMDLTPSSITAFIIGVKNRATALHLQKAINSYDQEALMAVVPGVALSQMRQAVGLAETAFAAVTVFVIVVGLMSVLVTMLTSLNERRREMAVLRAVGARPGMLVALLLCEAGLIGFFGALLGVGLTNIGLLLAEPVIEGEYGLVLVGLGLGQTDWLILAAVTLAAMVMALVPAWRAYRGALADGLSVRT
jgi:putative ABC transport system permease protein